MSLRFVAYVCLTLIAFGENAAGAIRVWHTAEALTSNASIDSQGSTGSYLELRCDNSVGNCQWRVTTQLRIDDGTSRNYSLRLRDTAGSATLLSVSQSTIAGSVYSNAALISENGPNGAISKFVASHPNPELPASSTVYFMHSFVLTKTAASSSETTLLMAGSSGFQGFEPNDPGDLRYVTIDLNGTYQYTFPDEEFNQPVIRISNFPEPGSLGLLFCGLVLVGGRRRQW